MLGSAAAAGRDAYASDMKAVCEMSPSQASRRVAIHICSLAFSSVAVHTRKDVFHFHHGTIHNYAAPLS